jgi:hypothetical protein
MARFDDLGSHNLRAGRVERKRAGDENMGKSHHPDAN